MRLGLWKQPQPDTVLSKRSLAECTMLSNALFSFKRLAGYLKFMVTFGTLSNITVASTQTDTCL
jgi:hypothetical protein